MALSILGIGTVTALGSGIETLQEGLKGNIQPRIESKTILTDKGSINLAVYKALVEGIDRFIDKRALRRIDYFAQLALLSTYLALEDAKVELTDKSRIGVIFGSGYGPTRTTFKFLDNVIEDGDFGASPTHFANSVHNSLASQVSIFLKISGPCSTITCFEHTLSNVLITAQNWLDQGIVDFVLAGLGDEYCDVLGYAAAAMNAGKTTQLQPFNFRDCTFLPGEGHITFLFSGDGREKTKYGVIKKMTLRRKIDTVVAELSETSNPLMINACGWRTQNESFAKLIFNDRPLAAYTGLYGSMPIGAALDLAIAAISLKEKTLFPAPQGSMLSNQNLKIIRKKQILRNTAISCLEYCDQDEFNIYQLEI